MPETILVVDDDVDILEALTEILEGEGFVIRRAKHGREALAELGPTPPDLILLDLMMPVMDGWEFARQLKQNPALAAAPIVVLSADRDLSGRAQEIGAAAYLSKPFELRDLLEVVRRVLQQRP